MVTDNSRYESRGVSSDKSDVHQAIRKLDHGLYKNTFCKILADPFSNNADDNIILHADTAGTKTILAYLYWKETGDLNVWKGIAQDALVMNVDDMACSGAVERFIISNTILRNKKLIPVEVLEAIIEGTLEFAHMLKPLGIDIIHAGGETADVGDVIRTIDVGYTAYTRLNAKKVFVNQIQAGDLILGLGSAGQTSYESTYNSGISCNGLTSARHDVLSKYYLSNYPESFDSSIDSSLVYIGKYRMTDLIDLGPNVKKTIGELLLSPTRTFLPLLHQMMRADMEGIHGIIHGTGGAHSKVLKFVEGVHIIKDHMPEAPVIFQIIKECSQASVEEMYKVFNMGIRLEIYGSASALERVQIMAEALNIPNQIIGRVEGQESPVPTITMQVDQQKWSYQ